MIRSARFFALRERGGPRLYAFTVALVLVALLLRLAIAPLSAGLQYVTFFPAVTLASVFGGYRAGLFATVIGLAFRTFILTPPYYTFSLEVLELSFWSNMVFLLDGIVVSFTFEAMHRYREKYAEELRIARNAEALARQHMVVIDTAHDGFWIVDLAGRILETNQAYAQMSGYSIAELTGMSISQLEAQEDREAVEAHIAKVLAEGYGLFETRHRHKDGHAIDVEVSVNYMAETQRFFAFFRDISERKASAERLQQAKQFMDTLVDNMPVMVFLKRAGDLRFELFNRAGESLVGYPASALLGKNDHELFPKEQADAFAAEDRRALASDAVVEIPEERVITADGETRYLRTRKVALRDPSGRPTHLLGISLDITESKRAQEALRIAAATFETHDAIMVTDANANILRVNRAFEKITGYAAQEVLGNNPRVLASGRHDREFYAGMWRDLLSEGTWEGEVWDRRKNGQIYPKWSTITALKDPAGVTTEYVAIFRDITERMQAEAEIRNLAFYDALTELPNRRLFLDRFNSALAASARSKLCGAVFFLDMDKFKVLNDTHGHGAGDRFLIEVAARIKFCVRDVDTVARIGGDEFVVLVGGLGETIDESSQKAALIAEKIRSSLAVPYQIGSHKYHSSPSIGVCLYCGEQTTVDDLIRYADVAMYQAKASGRNTVRFYDPILQQAAESRAALESDLRQAIAERQFQLYYQIQIDQERRPVGAEALIRWQHPQRGMISPADFIPVAEESLLIVDIGRWVLDEACRQLAAWQRSDATRGLQLAINVSAHQFRMPDFVELVESAILRHRIDAGGLKLELTETVILDDIAEVVRKMHALKGLGVRLSLDDFGTGYSSLSYLKRLPIDQIKIDQSFIRDLSSDPSDAMMVVTIIDMARNYRLHVIAEGVETEAQHDFLRAHACTAFQGFLFGKPVPIETFEASLHAPDGH